MKNGAEDQILGILSALGIFYLFEIIYATLRGIIEIYYGFSQVLEIIKLSSLFTSIPSLAIGIVVWKRMKLSKEFRKWFIIVLLIVFSLQTVRYLIWYCSYAYLF